MSERNNFPAGHESLQVILWHGLIVRARAADERVGWVIAVIYAESFRKWLQRGDVFFQDGAECRAIFLALAQQAYLARG